MGFARKKAPRRELPSACLFCVHATPLAGSETLLCEKKGVVGAEYHCRKFSYDPLKHIPPPSLVRKMIETQQDMLSQPEEEPVSEFSPAERESVAETTRRLLEEAEKENDVEAAGEFSAEENFPAQENVREDKKEKEE